jgi:single-strand DNA-binding protein
MAMNKVILDGRLVKDVELRYTESGKAVANFALAVQRDYKDQDGNRPTDFPQLVIWGQKAEALANFNKKGDRINIVGRIETRSYENQNQQTVWVAEINVEDWYFVQSVEGNENTGQGQGNNNQNQNRNNNNNGNNGNNRNNNNRNNGNNYNNRR